VLARPFVRPVKKGANVPGEKDVVAAVVPANGPDIDVRSVFAACRTWLDANFVPTYLQVVEEIPKSASEKLQERLLLAEFDPAAVNVRTEPRG